MNVSAGDKVNWHVLRDGKGIAEPQGFFAAGVQAHVKYPGKYDVALVYSQCPAAAAAVYTSNLVQAHPLALNRRHLADGRAQALVVNSGNANACLGQQGDEAAWAMAEETAQALGLAPTDVVVASTGVIGQRFPTERVRAGIRQAAEEIGACRKMGVQEPADRALSEQLAEGAHLASLAIMTTDLVQKQAAYELKLRGGTVRLGIMAKGSGMIHPQMGTMLAFVTTDACVEAGRLQDLLREAVDESFNMITIDGDTSTNDMVVALANGCSGVELADEDWAAFCDLFREACRQMARAIASDGEGASKLLTVQVTGASSKEQARRVARAVCGSNLVKCAMYGRDANWGRIICAAGYAGVEIDPGKVSIFLNGLPVAAAGQEVPFDEREASQRLSGDSVTVHIDLSGDRGGEMVDAGSELVVGNGMLGVGNRTLGSGFSATAWGCDLTHKYIDINADYRS
ncbi:MAG: bifunctional glutamate N-acetyltransferase/amino-acid acetyltransferase ArgJ [Peptococcaceae bacterium]|nr:bifunctional glutamate N-acetyltransferase/amino-acid acetyltransferase ArgJ [Peptococcaceae bacterium]